MTTRGRRSALALVPRAATLDGFAKEVALADGVSLHDLEPLTTLVVHTCNSLYRIIVSQRTAVLIQGGSFFPDVTEGQLQGSSLGGSLLKVAWVGVGLCMEICAGGQRIVTSPVRAITREATPASTQYCH
jgi:hypothetical protein